MIVQAQFFKVMLACKLHYCVQHLRNKTEVQLILCTSDSSGYGEGVWCIRTNTE